jgi:predicted ATPase/DNA-binding XRE family transcriptional regulator
VSRQPPWRPRTLLIQSSYTRRHYDRGVPADRGPAVHAFGDRLRTFREQAGLTQEELAHRAGLTPNAISALERGTRTRPYPHTVRSLAAALELSDEQRAVLVDSIPRRQTAPSDPGAGEGSASSGPPGPGPDVELVVPPTPLFGRDPEIATIAQIARSRRSRLITLTGPGGVGKTRLAAAVGHELAGDRADGVVGISLAALTDAGDVVGTIGRALDVSGAERIETVGPLAEQLGPRRLLLVLDNFEHLLSAAPDVGRLVAMCPDLTMLITSRSPLRVRGEQEYAVGPLTLPSPDVASVESLAGSAAGAFVLHRAAAVSSRPLTVADVRALGELCRRLAGIPLAIELATARLRLLTPPALMERLDDIGASGPRDLPERQRTMRATLDWSYGLLSEPERTLFRLLGVFRGVSTLTDIEEVARRSNSVPADDALALLEGLVEHSLVVAGPDGRLGVRYNTLEPVARYARSLLIGDEAARAVKAHTGVFLDLAEQAAAGYEGPDQLLWLDRIQADEANLLVAIDRALDGGDSETAGRIVWAMWLYWFLRAKPLVGLKRALRCLTAEMPPSIRARVHLAAATTAYAAGQVTVSAEHWEQGSALAAEHDDAAILGAARAGTGLAALALGDLSKAEDRFREALPLTEQAGDVWMTSLLHVWLGTILLLRRDATAASVEITRGLTISRERGDRLAIYVGLYNLAQAVAALGDFVAARRHLNEGITLSEENYDLANLAYFLEALAVVESAEAAPDRIPVLLGAAQTLHETTNHKTYGYYVPDDSLREHAEQQARLALGDLAFLEAVEAGRRLDVQGSVRFALGAPPG